MNDFRDKLKANIKHITDLFTHQYLTGHGSLISIVDGRTGSVIDGGDLFVEFGNYAPFLWLAGEEQLILDQFGSIERHFERNPLLFNRPQVRRTHGIGLPGPLRRIVAHRDSYDYVSLLYGCCTLSELSGLDKIRVFSENLFNLILKDFYRRGFIRTWRILPWGPTLPVTDALSGMYIELAAELARLTRKQHFFELAEQLALSWLSIPFFKKYNIFPTLHLESPWNGLPKVKEYCCQSGLAKDNTAVASGLLNLAAPPYGVKWAVSALHTLLAGLKKHFLTEDNVLKHLIRLGGRGIPPRILSNNIAALELLCDFHSISPGDECLSLARSIAHHFLDHQSPETNLIPDEPGTNLSFLDANTDFAVALYKLAELTHQPEYYQAGERLVQGIIMFHKASFGYFRDVHLRRGTPLHSTVETKYVALLLKALHLYLHKPLLYDHKCLWKIYRDR